jgi:hypothetical protein
MSRAQSTLKLVTVGVYGFTADTFFEALQCAGVDTFCDIRWRRAVRGREYAFANKTRLEQRLKSMGVRYLHFRDLAPTPNCVVDRLNWTRRQASPGAVALRLGKILSPAIARNV